MTAYYNEIDPYAAQWLRNLIDAGHIARGDVDERSIADVRPDDLAGYTQCHFFAGIGGWSLALRLADWPDDRPVWTGSCPCQPFSAAGAGKAADDERHLWPRWFPLIAERRPAIVFGEQVEAAIGWGWLDAVFADLEGEGYACGATVLPACGVGAPHIRARTWFMADASGELIRGRCGRDGGSPSEVSREIREQRIWPDNGASGTPCELAHADGGHASAARLQRGGEYGQQPQDGRALRVGQPDSAGSLQRYETAAANGHGHPTIAAGWLAGELGDAGGTERDGRTHAGAIGAASSTADREGQQSAGRIEPPRTGSPCLVGDAGTSRLSPRERAELPGPVELDQGRAAQQPGRSPWADLDWLPCTDGKARPVESGTFPLAHGIPGRVGRLRAYGNAIVPQAAAEFIRAAIG